ncbi:unnamed protein product, partial [marine sediment metagenome]
MQAVTMNEDQIRSSTADEDINMLCLAADHLKDDAALKILKAW